MLPPSPLDPDAGPHLTAPWETDDASPIATSSPRRVEDAPPARMAGTHASIRELTGGRRAYPSPHG